MFPWSSVSEIQSYMLNRHSGDMVVTPLCADASVIVKIFPVVGQ